MCAHYLEDQIRLRQSFEKHQQEKRNDHEQVTKTISGFQQDIVDIRVIQYKFDRWQQEQRIEYMRLEQELAKLQTTFILQQQQIDALLKSTGENYAVCEYSDQS
jgi:hypothetical protein